LSLSEICWRSGVPIEGEQEGESRPFEAGRGKYSPPASPERVTPEALKRRDNGFPLIKTFSEQRRASFFETSSERLEAESEMSKVN
jgi:hypothetical protein